MRARPERECSRAQAATATKGRATSSFRQSAQLGRPGKPPCKGRRRIVRAARGSDTRASVMLTSSDCPTARLAGREPSTARWGLRLDVAVSVGFDVATPVRPRGQRAGDEAALVNREHVGIERAPGHAIGRHSVTKNAVETRTKSRRVAHATEPRLAGCDDYASGKTSASSRSRAVVSPRHQEYKDGRTARRPAEPAHRELREVSPQGLVRRGKRNR